MNQTTILIGLFICHWLADYTPLSTAWMLNAKRLGKPLFPILVHALSHASLMAIFLIGCSYINNNMIDSIVITIGLYAFQIISHFIIDVWKGRMNGWFPSLQSPANKWHWIVFGFDQLLHAIVIIIMSHYAVN